MKNYIFAIMAIVLILSGCVNKKENTATNTKQQNIEKTSNENINRGKLTVIEDIKSWRHPVKDIFECKEAKVTKVEIADENNYYIFHLDSLEESYFTNRKFLTSIAEKIGYKNFKISSEEHYAEVQCDKIEETVKNVTTDFAKVEFMNKKRETAKENGENSKKKKADEKLSAKQQKAIELGEKFARKNLRDCGYAEGITNMSIDNEDGDEIVLKVWNQGSSIAETIDWLIVDLKSNKVTSENFSN